MGRLVVMRRPGILVVSGLVEEVNGDEIVISNEGLTENMSKLRLTYQPGTLSRMQLNKGVFIVSTASDDFRIEMMLDGAKTEEKEIALKGLIPRFNGSFDFDRRGTEKEQHVFSGNILSAENGGTETKRWQKITLGWKRNGKDEVRTIVHWGEPISVENGKRAIFVTGEKKVSGSMVYYNASKCIL